MFNKRIRNPTAKLYHSKDALWKNVNILPTIKAGIKKISRELLMLRIFENYLGSIEIRTETSLRQFKKREKNVYILKQYTCFDSISMNSFVKQFFTHQQHESQLTGDM